MISEVLCNPNTLSLGVKQNGKKEADNEWWKRLVCEDHVLQPCIGNLAGIQKSSQG